MDADERLMALKRAYADIILNTEKEAAARIMVSERKAMRFEYELKKAKEDAIRMLLRVKKMMDCKISEAAVTSCIQEKKIEELEAQLQEAEDIVKDLREELRTVEAELERFSQIKEVKHMVQVDNAPELQTQITEVKHMVQVENATAREPVTFTPSEIPNSYIDQTNKSQRCFNPAFPLTKSLISNGDLPSIILRSKETELYRNGCTQRIRACEHKTPNKISSFSLQTNDINKNINPNLISEEGKVVEKELVLEEVKEIDLAAGNTCLTSPNSGKHTNDILVDENLVSMCNSQSTSGDQVMPVSQEKDKVDPPLISTESKVSRTNEVTSQPLTDRVIKYTFQRKRKRGALISGSGSNEGNHENQTTHMESVKDNLIGEPTSEKIHLEEVACQLISLSDKMLVINNRVEEVDGSFRGWHQRQC